MKDGPKADSAITQTKITHEVRIAVARFESIRSAPAFARRTVFGNKDCRENGQQTKLIMQSSRFSKDEAKIALVYREAFSKSTPIQSP